MKIIKKVLIKQIITDESKRKIESTFNTKKMRLEQECQQLLFEQRKLQHQPGLSKRDVKERFQQEIERRKEKIEMIDFKLEQLEMLEIGSEIVEGEVDAFVEVQEGAHWDQVMGEQAIVIKDDIVIRIENV
ncbi:MAG TPA: YlqD family protein [Virgibacillus sp.]|nr:YlqD family protein [Virgibacillus sp.]